MDDTHPEARRVQIELLRKMGPERRAAIGSQLSNTARWRTRQTIARLHPNLSDADREILFIRHLYGKDLAERVRNYRASRPNAYTR